jgi:NAD(P)H-dependent FMN reductase
MTTLIGISGSLRSASYNTALLRAAAQACPAGTTLEIASIREIPLYDAELEARAFPEAVSALKERIARAQGLVIATPEYNNGIPGVLKNAIDWLSRPPADIGKVFAQKPVALMGATPGPGGTTLAQAAFLPVLRTLGALAWFGPKLYVSSAAKVFDAEGKLVDEAIRTNLGKYMSGFSEFAQRTAS